MDWAKSSYSNSYSNCVEVAWRKPRRSESGNCVEIAEEPDWVWVRDSKHPEGPVLKFTRAEWEQFTGGLQEEMSCT